MPWEVVFASELDPVYVQNLLLLVPYRNELCTKQDLQYLLAFFTCLRNRFPDADASQLAEADIRLPSQRAISAWDAVALLAGKQLIEVPVKEKDLFVCTMQDFEVKHVS